MNSEIYKTTEEIGKLTKDFASKAGKTLNAMLETEEETIKAIREVINNTYSNINYKTFTDLENGSYFEYKNKIYLKFLYQTNLYFNAICLEDGECFCFNFNDLVVPIEVDIKWNYLEGE